MDVLKVPVILDNFDVIGDVTLGELELGDFFITEHDYKWEFSKKKIYIVCLGGEYEYRNRGYVEVFCFGNLHSCSFKMGTKVKKLKPKGWLENYIK